MKKLILLTIFTMTTLLIGCSGTSYHAITLAESTNTLLNATKPTQGRSDDLGFRLSLSQRSSLDIDVEGILDYYKGTPIVDSLAQQPSIQDPWICYNISF